ncbi:hypothetical protein PHYBLDRAFT_77351 [Phycomyces blakesleeanus NRRL 1555(-)]|nr:hypothetical protein PHYBLDRAFT_77351 [Phycomyces blakesleeanus NRRL 1555(-)]OAD68766.1 hypothetical protein PHYBLDRAFT_77351 [Phycomyces blakesleeanus NRRL 1555(-)]|eukprot:XP_018286806.1 hypothetical protein PHYBLDRAFT_77351 [Phycomyces blakesleeanus NRRL 1555(-)]
MSAVVELYSRLVHKDPTKYKGRLGYACINTVLRKQKVPVFCSRTCRIDTLKQKGIEYVKDLALQNVKDLKTLIEWNNENKITFMRMSSDIFPFASHDDYGYSLEYAKDNLEEIGKLAHKYNHRLTTHPGQYNQLGSPTPKVVLRTIKDLNYHADMMDYMGLPPDSIMIMQVLSHMGGVYGDKCAAMARFEKVYNDLPENIKRRLVLENDEMCYSVSDLLPLCQRLNIPLVLDWHHHSINPGEVTDLVSLVPSINETWTRRGLKPKQHYSESRKGASSMMERRAHSDSVKNLPPTGDDVDLMIEAKDKEQAVLQLYKDYNLCDVKDESFVPYHGNETMETKGRKSNKKVKEEAKIKVESKIKEEDEDFKQGLSHTFDTKETIPHIRTRLQARLENSETKEVKKEANADELVVSKKRKTKSK